MALIGKDKTEWLRLQKLAKEHNIKVKRVGPANVEFPNGVIVQLGSGYAMEVLKAQIRIKQKRYNFGYYYLHRTRVASMGKSIMLKAKQIREANPNKKWTKCVKEAAKILKKKSLLKKK